MQNRLNKKILFLSSWYPSEEQPTLGNFVQKHAQMAQSIASIDVLYAISSNNVSVLTISDKQIDGVRTVIVTYPKIKNKWPIWQQLEKKTTYLNALQKGFEYLNSSYDLVHLNVVFPAGLFALELFEKKKLDYVLTVHWTGFLASTNGFNKLSYLVKNQYKKIFSKAKAILPVSGDLGQALVQLNLTSTYSVLANAVDGSSFYPKNGKMDNVPTFLHVSSFDEQQKNISGMLRCFAKLGKDFRLHIVTETDEVVVWEQLKKYDVPAEKCTVESRVSPSRVGALMQASDALVLFSNYETFSVVLAEAWSCGIPAIYSKCGGLTNINNPKLGIQIAQGDENALLKALQSFSMGNYSSEIISTFAQQFGETQTKAVLKSIYEKFT